ncbi:hypothetical protein KIPB_011161, partial [Kipferlia bialata]
HSPEECPFCQGALDTLAGHPPEEDIHNPVRFYAAPLGLSLHAIYLGSSVAGMDMQCVAPLPRWVVDGSVKGPATYEAVYHDPSLSHITVTDTEESKARKRSRKGAGGLTAYPDSVVPDGLFEKSVTVNGVEVDVRHALNTVLAAIKALE